MNFPLTRMYRLLPRGRGGLTCDEAGVALGPTDLARVGADAAGRPHSMIRPPERLEQIISAAYGPQREDVVLRLHRGLRRAAKAIEVGDLCLAGIETVLLGLPDLSPQALAKLAEVAELEKGGTAWQNEPRVPAGQPDGGQWTTAGGARGAATAPVKPAAPVSPHVLAPHSEPPLPLDDGVYRPVDDPRVILVGGAEEESESRRSNGPPDDYTRLEDVFPGLRAAPGLAVPLAPIDAFLGFSAGADKADAELAWGQYWGLIHQIQQIDPTFKDEELFQGGIEGLTRQGRTNLINHLRMVRAVAYYRGRDEVGPLQVEALRFLQDAVDAAYAHAVGAADAGRLQPRLSRQQAIGDSVDHEVRQEFKRMIASYFIPFGRGGDVTINNRDYETLESGKNYRVPDARLKDVGFDWTLSLKTIDMAQIRGFFRADSQPRAVIIIRPSELGGSYLIPRPANAWLYPWL